MSINHKKKKISQLVALLMGNTIRQWMIDAGMFDSVPHEDKVPPSVLSVCGKTNERMLFIKGFCAHDWGNETNLSTAMAREHLQQKYKESGADTTRSRHYMLPLGLIVEFHGPEEIALTETQSIVILTISNREVPIHRMNHVTYVLFNTKLNSIEIREDLARVRKVIKDLCEQWTHIQRRQNNSIDRVD